MIDIGVNFHSSQLKGLAPQLLSRAAAAGVTHILATGTSLHASELAIAFAREHAQVWATAGVHPHDAKHWNDASGTQFAPLWADECVVAVGECGLDYNRMFSPREDQRRAFEAQIAAGVRLDKPLFLHSRDAFDDSVAMLREAASAGAHGVVHCFTDGAAEAEAYLALGFDIGITGWVTDAARGAALRDALRVIPRRSPAPGDRRPLPAPEERRQDAAVQRAGAAALRGQGRGRAEGPGARGAGGAGRGQQPAAVPAAWLRFGFQGAQGCLA